MCSDKCSFWSRYHTAVVDTGRLESRMLCWFFGLSSGYSTESQTYCFDVTSFDDPFKVTLGTHSLHQSGALTSSNFCRFDYFLTKQWYSNLNAHELAKPMEIAIENDRYIVYYHDRCLWPFSFESFPVLKLCYLTYKKKYSGLDVAGASNLHAALAPTLHSRHWLMTQKLRHDT